MPFLSPSQQRQIGEKYKEQSTDIHQ